VYRDDGKQISLSLSALMEAMRREIVVVGSVQCWERWKGSNKKKLTDLL